MAAHVRFALVSLWLFSAAAFAGPLTSEAVPEPLKPWIPWVLRGHEDRICPFLFDQWDVRRCSWPGRLALELNAQGGRFEAALRLYAAGWSPLPGDVGHWPQNVSESGRPLVVTAAEGEPRVWLDGGTHRVSGSFRWERLPETLTVPRSTGLLRVTVDGHELPFPAFKDQGQLWLRTSAAVAAPEAAENRVEVEVFRRIVDERPLQVVTRIVLRVAGVPRDAVLAGAALPGAIPLSLDSPLPARVEPDGRLRLQLRPGSWNLDVTSRFSGETAELRLPEAVEPWPQQEVWSFDPRNALRLVQIEGPVAIDPRQTNVPQDWQSLPAYRMAAGEAMEIRTLRRGDPEPEPDRLQLDRSLWLDFDGGGYTVTDRISGSMTRNWRLDADTALRLGRVSLDDEPQPITRLAEEGPEGVEVRRGALQLSADSRFDGLRAQLPATGWAQDFQRVQARLNLPPGWRLLAATGVENAPDTWVGRWTLLDLFVVLIAGLAAARLWNPRAGALMLVGLALLWQEPGAPRYLWLNLLVAIALLRLVPEGRLAAGLRIYRTASFGLLLLLAIPFAYDQVRWGFYPQLEQPWRQPDSEPAGSEGVERAAAPPMESMEEEAAVAAASDEAAPSPMASLSDYASRAVKRSAAPRSAPPPAPASARDDIDPRAITQTGPGVPRWQWRSVQLSWNGPVVAGQKLGLVLLSPATNLVLNLLRVILLIALGLRLAGLTPRPRWGAPVLFIPLMFGFVPGSRADFPPPDVLEQLSRGLLEAPDCLPSCADIARLRLDVRDDTLTQSLDIHAQQRVSVPVPGQEGQWMPETATLDGQPVEAMVREPDGSLRVAVEPGRHELTLVGRLPAREQVALTLPLVPRLVEARSIGWTVEGVREDGTPDSQLRLLRQRSQAGGESLLPGPLEPFVEVTRLLRVGLDWRVQTTVTRRSPSDQSIALEVPLLDGEAVTTAGIRVRDGRAIVNLPPGIDSLAWTSILGSRDEIRLRAPETGQWVETWQLDAGPMWHVVTSGIAVVHHRDAGGNWLPEWQPWAGEQVTIHLARPLGAPGNTLTIDDSRLELRPGRRALDGVLALTLRSAQGTQHPVQLPDGAQLLSATVDGAAQPLRQQGRVVTLPVHPGKQHIALNWRAESGLKSLLRTPVVDLGVPSVNHRIDVELGQDRWLLLLGGPQWGPAVLYWGMVAVIAVLALGLGRISWTPLGFASWLLLLIGLSQIPLLAGFIVVMWLLALGRRATMSGQMLSDRRFNAIQAGLAALTLAALLTLGLAVQQGLLGYPEMQIAGNASTSTSLHWYQDRSAATPPQAWMVSVPLWVYRVAMLAWALWLAAALLHWLRWGWACFTAGGLWRRTAEATAPSRGKSSVSEDPWLEDKPPAG
ncbi:hypothetical protein ACW73L_08730 [Methylolobus aquaticus]